MTGEKNRRSLFTLANAVYVESLGNNTNKLGTSSKFFPVSMEGHETVCDIQGCWANSDDFSGKSLELIFVIIRIFSQILTT